MSFAEDTQERWNQSVIQPTAVYLPFFFIDHKLTTSLRSGEKLRYSKTLRYPTYYLLLLSIIKIQSILINVEMEKRNLNYMILQIWSYSKLKP